MNNDEYQEPSASWIFATLSTADSYIRAIKILLESFQINYQQNIKAEIGCLSWEPKLIDEFRENFPSFNFRPLDLTSGANVKEQAIRWKPRFIYELLRNFPHNSIVIFTDADHVVLKNLQGLFENMSNFDIGLRHRPEHQSMELKYAAGVIGVKNSKLGREAILQWKNLVSKNTGNWWVDQVTLVELANFCESIGASIWKMDDSTLSIDTGNLKSYLWCRSNWELDFEDRLEQNHKLLKDMRKPK